MGVLKAPDIQAQALVVRAAIGSAESAAALEATIERRRRTVDLNAAAERLFEEAKAERLRVHAEVEALVAAAKADTAETYAEAKRRVEEAGETILTLREAREYRAQQEREAEAIRAQALQVVADAEASADAIREAARAEGRQQGRDEIAEHIEVALQLAANAKVERAQLIAEAEPDVIGVAVEIARRIIHAEVQARPDFVQDMVSRALQRVTAQDGIRVRLNPETMRQLGDSLRRAAASYAERGVEVVGDESVERVGVVVETRRGTVDGRLETQLERVSSTFSGLAGAAVDSGGARR
jgi:flagellar assembly protein FliH